MIFKRGFLLLELTLSITLFLLLIGLSFKVPSIIDKFLLTSAVTGVASFINYAHLQSSTTGIPCTIFFDEECHACCMGTDRYTLPAGCCFGVLPGMKGPPGKPEHPLNRAITFERNSLVITPEGASTAGTIYIIDGQQRYQGALTVGVGISSCPRTYYVDGTSWVWG